MPSPLDALNYAKRMTGNMPVDDVNLKLRILNDAHNELWMAAPWRWTVGEMDIVTWVNNQQDYSVSAPSDFLFLVHSYSTDGETKNDVNVAAALPSTSAITGKPSEVAYVAGTGLRFLPVPIAYTAFPKVITRYKKEPTPITESNDSDDYETTFGVPAAWFGVYQDIVLGKAFQFSNSPKLGSVTLNAGGVQYSGQLGVIQAAIARMREAEKKFLDSLGQAVQNG